MLRIILVLLLFVTVAYWVGYRIGSSAYDLRPICFVVFGDALEKGGSGIALKFWGYEERPNCNDPSLEFFGITYKETPVYFLIERHAILAEAEGQKITAVVNMGRYSRRNNPLYMLRLLRTGKFILLDEGNEQKAITENMDISKTEGPGE